MSNEDRPALLVLPDRIRINRRGWFLVVAAVIIALLPFVIQDSYWRTNLIVCAINVMLAIGLDFILGYAGQLNLGHSAFYGIGAYASTLLIMRLGVPFWMAFVFGMVLSGAAGMALSIFAVRLRGHYLAIASLGFAVIVHQVLLNWISLTQGPLGIYAIKPPPDIALPGLPSSHSATRRTCSIWSRASHSFSTFCSTSWSARPLARPSLRSERTRSLLLRSASTARPGRYSPSASARRSPARPAPSMPASSERWSRMPLSSRSHSPFWRW